MSWFSGFESIVRAEVPLREITWFKLGGPARWLCEPRDEAELTALLARIRTTGIPWRVLGSGANVIARDEGFDGVVLRLRGPVFQQVRFEDHTVYTGAGADLPGLIRETLKRGLVGLEVLAGIPGTVGGAVRMNAGGRHGEIGRFVRELRLLDPEGRLLTRTAVQVGFAYRHVNLGGCIVLGVRLALEPGDTERALERYGHIRSAKHRSQPPIGARSAGCIFKNPAEKPAWRLLDEAGLRGARVGGAEISPLHANFILAGPDATAADVLALIRLAKERVWKATGTALQPEVQIW